MTAEMSNMRKFNFLVGQWNLEYRVPKSTFSEEASGSGSGTFRRALGDKYVFFDYSCSLTTGDGEAHGIFAWDEKLRSYRFWWFEDSGAFQTATCNFVSDDLLFMNWHDTLLKQTFERVDRARVVLRMEYPDSDGNYQLVLEVIFTRK